MTSTTPTAGTTSRTTSDAARDLQGELIRFKRSLNLLRQTGNLPGEPQLASVPILKRLSMQGPLRSRDIADQACLDPSTVSRQVDQLVRAGHVRRTADPDDGRATLLEITPSGLDQLSAHSERITTLLQDLLEDWTPTELDVLTASLRRLNEDAVTRLPSLIDRMRHTAS